jgi:hypothetical protein
MKSKRPLIETLPSPQDVRRRLGDALREAQLLRRLLRLAVIAEEYRQIDRDVFGTPAAATAPLAPTDRCAPRSPA